MRAARAGDYWRRAFARNYSIKFEKLGYANLLGLGGGEVHFRSGVTIIVGANGVGKSTMVAAIVELLGGDVALKELDHSGRLRGSAANCTLRSGEAQYQVSVAAQPEGRKVEGGLPPGVTFSWIDPAYQTAQSRRLISQDAAFSEVLESIGPRKLNEAELALVCYVVGKAYESCSVYEVPEYGGIEEFPYFRVVADGVEYGSETMGQGELSLLFVLWELLTLPRNSILLIEEPETHVSPRSQEALMNAIVQSAAENGTWVIITTHSPSIVSRVPKEHIRLLTRDQGSVIPIEGAARFQLAAILGGGGGYQGVVLVEDEVGKHFVISLLDAMDPDLLRQYEIVNARSNGGIASALSSMPRTGEWFTLVGAYDGDQRTKVETKKNPTWPMTFLPTDKAPERIFQDVAKALGLDAIAKELSRPRETIAPVFDAAAGQDPHDWIHSIAAGLGLGLDSAVRLFVRLWLTMEGSRESCKEFVDALRVR